MIEPKARQVIPAEIPTRGAGVAKENTMAAMPRAYSIRPTAWAMAGFADLFIILRDGNN